MKPAPFDYYAPTTIEEACALLADAGGGATILAGGQTLLPLLALRMSQPFVLVDINKIAALKGVARLDGATRVGSVVTQNEAIDDPMLNRLMPLLVTATRHVGHHQTRNRGTIGGSIALGEPAAELPATAVALGASIEVRSVRGVRRIQAEDFYLAPYSTALTADELITSVDFPDWPVDAVPVFREVAQRPGDFALLGVTGMLAIQNGRISRASMAWFGMGSTPTRARQVEAELIGKDIAAIDARALAELAIADTTPFDDRHASAEYRRTVGRKIFEQTLLAALQLRRAA